FGAAALCALGGVPAHSVFGRIARAVASPRAPENRILVVLALSGGNDGLNTVVPYGDDAYYRHRPTIGLQSERLLRLDDHFALNPGMVGFERLWQAGDLAIVHGCGYDDPSFSHAAALANWHTAAPGRGAGHGWLGRLADAMGPRGAPALAIGAKPALASRGRGHAPAEGAFALAREARADYRTPIDYGPAPLGLSGIAALIAADAPARLYYASFRGNAFRSE